MPELNKLYQERILDHNKNPRNYGKIENPAFKAEGYNPVCGDQVAVYLNVEQGLIVDIRFEGSGCAISKASASMMMEAVSGKSIDDAKRIYEALQRMLETSSKNEIDKDLPEGLHALSGVRHFPVRVKCALLPWQTLHSAMSNDKV